MNRRSAIFAVLIVLLAFAVGALYRFAPRAATARPAKSVIAAPRERASSRLLHRSDRAPSSASSIVADADAAEKPTLSPAFAHVAPQNRALVACDQDSRCPENTICMPVDQHTVGCFGSTCRGAAHSRDDCGQGRSCVLVDVPHHIHRCANAGNAELGQDCSTVRPAAVDKTCDVGLECIAGRCRESCRDGTCAAGERCIQVNDADRFCVDNLCQSDRDCPPGSACVDADLEYAFATDFQTCLSIGTFPDGTRSCTASSCGPGELCDLHRDGTTLRARCRKPCNSLVANSCPPGFACGRSIQNASSLCYRICKSPGDCPKGESCGGIEESMTTWACTEDDGLDPRNDDGLFENPVKTFSVSELLRP